jgi:hypothetical protein
LVSPQHACPATQPRCGEPTSTHAAAAKLEVHALAAAAAAHAAKHGLKDVEGV